MLASKKLQSLNEKIAKVHDEILKLDEQITSTKRMIVSLKSGSKDDHLCCKELNANVNELSIKTKQLRSEHRKVLYLMILIKYKCFYYFV